MATRRPDPRAATPAKGWSAPSNHRAKGAPRDPGWRTTLELCAALIALFGTVYITGVVVTWVRAAAARLPGDVVVSALGDRQLFGAGLRSTALTAAAFAALSVLAYLTSTFRWSVNGQDWHDIVNKHGVGNARADPAAAVERDRRIAAAARRKSARRLPALEQLAGVAGKHALTKPVAGYAEKRAVEHRQVLHSPAPRPKPLAPAPLGDGAVRIVAGFNLLVLAVLISLGLARGLEAILPSAWWSSLGSYAFLGAWLMFFLATHQLLIRANPLRFGPRVHGLPWVVIAVGALLASAPIGVLVLTGVAVSTLGRAIARIQPPHSAADAVRSPLLWILLAIVTLLALAYNAMPPVSFPGVTVSGVTVSGAAGTISGGYLNRTASGVYVVTCSSLADATSADERIRLLPAGDVHTVTLGGPSASLDSGDRPSLLTLGLGALGLNGAVHPLFTANLRPQRGTCGGANPPTLTGAVEDPSLGRGVIVATGTPSAQAHDGELPMEQTSPAPIAQLARRYQPTLLVTAADRFWPVSVNALLADRGPHDGPTCLMRLNVKPLCGTDLLAQDLSGAAARSTDYLQFPVRITHDPDGIGQFTAFQNGQYMHPGPLHAWLSDPGRLDPWYTAQIYFYWGRPVTFAAFPTARAQAPDPNARETFVPLEYWFYYPYNYFPLLATSDLMNAAPLAADQLNVDLHQGDWEHIDVLLDSRTLAPKWLYMARHSGEGQFIQWGSPSLALDGSHPLVQAAFGGHPTYEPGCGAQVRSQPGSVLVDWLVCGSGRFAFRATDTPLVDIASAPWACWPGHFGAAGTPQEQQSVGKSESLLDQARNQVFVAGPQAPVRQAENSGTCAGGPKGPEEAALTRYFISRARATGQAVVRRGGRLTR
jgi:hypothetical protein